jgi:hypothetical protein
MLMLHCSCTPRREKAHARGPHGPPAAGAAAALLMLLFLHHNRNLHPLYQLPSPEELKPFPCRLGREYIGHSSVVTCVDVHSSGQYIVTGSKDCTAKVHRCCCGVSVALPNHLLPCVRSGMS